VEAPIKPQSVLHDTPNPEGRLPHGYVFQLVENSARGSRFPLKIRLLKLVRRIGLVATFVKEIEVNSHPSTNDVNEIRRSMNYLLNLHYEKEYNEALEKVEGLKLKDRLGYYPPKRI
jgi:hypothetical protein